MIALPVDPPVQIAFECRLSAPAGEARKLLLGFAEPLISKVKPANTAVLDPAQMLNGASPTKIVINEEMPAGSMHRIEFGAGVATLSLEAIETAAFTAKLAFKSSAAGALSGQCFMIDGPIAKAVFERRQRGDWGKK
jgi:hypothetical protein